MADKSFGVKELNLISASGTPTITSPNSVNINATNVAISTDITVGGMVSLGAGTSISSPGSNILTFGTNSTEKVRITSAGNVQARRTRSNTVGDVALSIQPSDSTIHYGFRIDQDNNNLNLDRVGTGNFISITSSGDVGINTTSNNDGAHFQHYQSEVRHQSFQSSNGDLAIVTDNNSNPAAYIKGTGTADLLKVVDDTTEVFTIRDGGDIGIAKASPQNWGGGVPTIEIKGTASSGGNATRSGAIAFESGSGSNGYAVLWGQNGGIHIYTSATDRASATYAAQFNSSGNLAFASGNGIDFSATANGGTGTPSELFDDYEEGTWTPDLRFNNASSGMTYSRQEGHYTKIGRQVFAQFRITLTSKGTSTGTLTIRGLPFTSSDTFTSTGIDGQVHIAHDNGFNAGNVSNGAVSGYVEGGTDYFQMTVRDSNAALTTLTNVHIDNDLSIAGTAIFYA